MPAARAPATAAVLLLLLLLALGVAMLGMLRKELRVAMPESAEMRAAALALLPVPAALRFPRAAVTYASTCCAGAVGGRAAA